jgi:hypothetical protein
MIAQHARAARGRTEPRLWTPSLRALTPDTSMGFDQIEFARDVLRRPFDPWQEWLVIHAGELLPDGTPRFRIVLVLVARQNGKTEIPVILSCYWQFIDAFPLILGTSTKLDYAKESWDKAIKLIEKVAARDDQAARDIAALIPRRGWRRDANGEQESKTTEGCRYKIGPANREGGRSLTIDRLVLDELREHRTFDAWNATEPAASPWGAQIWALSNAGDDGSVVLNEQRKEALAVIGLDEREQPIEPAGDYRIGLFEWSSPPGGEPDDIDALMYANPSAGAREQGGRRDPEALLAKGRAAMRAGGDKLTGFRTEYMCQRVPKLDPAIDPAAWHDCLDPGDLSEVRNRLTACIDVSLDEQHATLIVAAVMPDGRVRVEAAHAWDGRDCLTRATNDLPAMLARVRPRVLGWLPSGPAAALAATLADRSAKTGKRFGWPPPGVTVSEIRGEVPAICMGLAREVVGKTLAHSDDPLINDHIEGAERLRRGDVWVFSRKGGGHCDAAYATAGAVHLARTMPTPAGRPRLVTVD